MEGYLYQQTLSSPPSWAVGGEASSPSHHQHHPRERRRGGKRGSGVKLSTDPQSVAARQRRHRISDRFRILKSLVPGGSKMDTVSMLEEAIHYVKFLKSQIWLHQAALMVPSDDSPPLSFPSSANTDAILCASSYATSTASTSSSSVVHPPQHMFGYSMAAPPSPLPPFPSCTFPGEDEMIPHVIFDY